MSLFADYFNQKYRMSEKPYGVEIMSLIWDWLFTAGSIVFVFVAIGFCIFSHELGHFLAAKWRGLHVDAFSIGFKAVWKKKYRGVEYRIGCLPFGGYCEIPQIDATDAVPKAADGTELPHAKPLDKIVTAAAGPLFNILSGFLIACVIWIWGMPQDTPKMREITVLSIDRNSPEYAAGLRAGDRIVKLNGERFFCTWANFTGSLLYTIGEVELTVVRDGRSFNVRYLPAENPNAPSRLKREHIAYPFFSPLIPIELVPRPGGAAERAGVRPGDRLVSVNGVAVTSYGEFQQQLDSSRGRPLKLTLLRKDRTVELSVIPTPVRDLGAEFDYYLLGVRFHREKPLEVFELIPGGAAEKAGILPGDVLLSLDGVSYGDNNAFFARIQEVRDSAVRLVVRRGDREMQLELAADRYVPMTIDAEISLRDYPSPWRQFMATLEMSWKALRGITVGIANKLGFTDKSSPLAPRHLSGPLGMGMTLFDSVRHSTLSTGIYFLVVISFALAIFNLLPLPVLDGGHILFGCVEAVIRRPLPVQVVKTLYFIFAGMLIMLMIYVTFSDVRRLYYNKIQPMLPESAAAESPGK